MQRYLPALALLVACASNSEAPLENTNGADEGLESDFTAAPKLVLPPETAPADSLAALPLAAVDSANAEYIDIRGVGDAGWSESKRPLAATYGETLDQFGTAYRGDLSFINWETVVGESCNTWGSASFYFLSRRENLDQLYARGFNLIGNANNHARDCAAGPDARGKVVSGERMTASHMAAASEGKTWLWAGVGEGDPTDTKLQTFPLKGKAVTVALGSGYFGSRRSCDNSVCADQVESAMQKVLATKAQIRILALHCMEVVSPAFCGSELTNAGKRFLELGGDVVFGHGPHVWRPVYVVRKKEGTSTNGSNTGVMFQSLGNFAHPALSDQERNLIGRALVSVSDLKLKQVQVLPVRNYREGVAPERKGRVRFSNVPLREVEGNVTFTAHPERSTVGFANIKE
jgi:Bacterial capsule synthesis protein PGA_cap